MQETDMRVKAKLPSVMITMPLSPRQLQILQFMVEGKSQKQIAGLLHLHPDTISDYVRRAKRRLGAQTSYQVIAFCVVYGYVNVPT